MGKTLETASLCRISSTVFFRRELPRRTPTPQKKPKKGLPARHIFTTVSRARALERRALCVCVCACACDERVRREAGAGTGVVGGAMPFEDGLSHKTFAADFHHYGWHLDEDGKTLVWNLEPEVLALPLVRRCACFFFSFWFLARVAAVMATRRWCLSLSSRIHSMSMLARASVTSPHDASSSSSSSLRCLHQTPLFLLASLVHHNDARHKREESGEKKRKCSVFEHQRRPALFVNDE